MSFVIELRQGATLIASRTPSLTTSLTTFEYDLTGPERAFITDWTLLRFHFIGDTDQTQVTWAEFEIPGSGAAGASAGTGTATGISAAVLGLQSAVGSAAGAATVLGGVLYRGDAAGTSTVTGVGFSLTIVVGLSVGTSAVTAFSVAGAVTAAVAASTSVAAVLGIAQATGIIGVNPIVGSAAGSATVLGNALSGNILTIAGVEFVYKMDSCTITESYQGVNTLQCTIWYPTLPTAVPFGRGDELIMTEDGTRIFGGYIDTVEAMGIGGEVPNAVEYRISAGDYKTLAECRNVIDGGFPAGFVLQTAFANTAAYLQPYGVTVDTDVSLAPPVLPLLLYDVRTIRSVWDEFCDITGYIWTIDYYKHATISLPGLIRAPFDVGFSQTAFIGPPYRYLIQQAEYYNYLPEGDARLQTWFTELTLAVYNAVMDTLDSYHATIIQNMPADERAAFDTAFLEAYANGFLAEDLNFLIQQAEYYQYLQADDPRLKTWFYAYTLTTYEAGIASIAGSLTSIINAMGAEEKTAFNVAYNNATVLGAVAATDQLGDITVNPSEIEYANRVIVRWGDGAKEIEDDLGGLTDGVQTAFPLTYSNLIAHRGYVMLNGVYETFLIGGGGTWDYDPTTNIVTRLSAPAAGSAIVFTYTSQFPQSSIATAWSEVETIPLKEVVLLYPDVFSPVTAQAIAEAWLPRYVAQPRSAKYRTRRKGIHPGMLQAVSVPDRHFDHTCFVSAVTITSTEYGFVRDVEVLQGALLQGSWRDLYRIWGSGGGGGGSGISGGIVLTSPPTTSGSGVIGSGTVDSIPKWLTINSIGDSGLQVDATNALIAGSTGAGFTVALSLSTITGTLADARLTSNVPLKDTPNAFAATSPSSFRSLAAATAALQIHGAPGDEWSTIRFYNAAASLECGFITGHPTTSLTISGTTDLTLETVSGYMYLSPAGDLLLDPTSNYVVPITSYDINIGRLTQKFLTLHAAELWVETLVAQNTIATIGGRILVLPTNILTADLLDGAGDTTINVKYNNLTVGDIVYMEADGKVEFMQVTFGPVGSPGAYQYLVGRNADGTGRNLWYAGDAIANTGQTGNGFIDLYSVRGVRSGSEIGPTIVGNVRTAHATPSTDYNAWSPRWAIGNLTGLYGLTSVYGVALGNPSATNIIIEDGDGFRIRHSTTVKFHADTSGNLAITGDLTIGTAGVFHTAAAVSLTSGTGIWMAGGTTPVFRVGIPAGNQIKWDGTDLTLVSASVNIGSTGISISGLGTTWAVATAYSFVSSLSGTNSMGLSGFITGGVSQHMDLVNITSVSSRNVQVTLAAANGTRSSDIVLNVDASNVPYQYFHADAHSFLGNIFPQIDNTVACGVTSFRWTAVYAVNGTIQTSDRRHKREIVDDQSLGLAFVNALQTKGFRYLDDEEYRIGFIAQEVQDALDGRPFAGLRVTPDHIGLNYAAFVPILTTAIQEMDRRLTALEDRPH